VARRPKLKIFSRSGKAFDPVLGEMKPKKMDFLKNLLLLAFYAHNIFQ